MFSNYASKYTTDFILQNSKREKIYQFSLCDKIMCTNHKPPNSYSRPEQTPGNAVKSAKFIHFFLFWRQMPSCSVQVLDKFQSTILRKKIRPYRKAPLRPPPCTSGMVFHMDTNTNRVPEFS